MSTDDPAVAQVMPRGAPDNGDLLHQVVAQMADGVAVFGVDDRLIYVNAALAAAHQCPPEQLIGRHLSTFVDATPNMASERARAETAGQPLHDVIRTSTADGERRDVSVAVSLLRRSDGSPMGRVVSIRDVTEHTLRTEQLKREAMRDPLTGLPNRRLLADRLDHALSRADRVGSAVAALFIDLDGFKAVNDDHGHLVGDELLVSVAAQFRAALRHSDTLARIGGDEFVVLIEDVTDGDEPTRTAERLLDSLSLPFQLAGTAVRISASIGIAVSRPDDRGDLLDAADRAMYSAKHSADRRIATSHAGATDERPLSAGRLGMSRGRWPVVRP